MSRSYRHSPFSGMTCAKSDKKDKVLWHRKFRRICKQRFYKLGEAASFREPKWYFSKDGKSRYNIKIVKKRRGFTVIGKLFYYDGEEILINEICRWLRK
jgi:hypothetical protein